MRISWVLLLWPVVSSAASFDCSQATTSIEKLICSDEELSRLDESLARAYQSAQSSDAAKAAKASQREWLKTRRNACAGRTWESESLCLQREYGERIFLLSAMSTPRQDIVGTYTRKHPACFVSSGPEGRQCEGEIEDVITVAESGTGFSVMMELYFFNGHQCDFEGNGDWQDGRLLVKAHPDQSQCTLELYSDGERITSYVGEGMSDSCWSPHCGARGSLDGATLTKNKD